MSSSPPPANGMTPRSKAWLMGVLVLCFIGQTTLVYTDTRSPVQLEGEALRGARLFQQHNCQSCHQIYGFGGFLGPDLTNIASRFGETRLRAHLQTALATGPGQMPVFDVPPADVDALTAWLVALDKSGTGQARTDAEEATFGAAVGGRLATADDAVRRGWQVFSSRPCSACHAPFQTSSVGAPDLTNVTARLEAPALNTVLSSGRPPRMPPPTPPFSDDERRDVISFLRWVQVNRGDLQADLRAARTVDWTAIPWWEYE